ncbi:LAFA_0G00540g1_1 [Lachancea sp. 'fantastica']|nr:LAFA_0G00540g1_1 [Lachancea sp. 'fantastica']
MFTAMDSKKTRITVLFESLQDLEQIAPDSQHGADNSESIHIKGSGQQVQHRTVVNHVGEFQHVRITWKGSTNTQTHDSFLEAPLMNGLNIYIVAGEPNKQISGAIKSAKYQLIHSDSFDENLVREYLPAEVFEVDDLDWKLKDYDITLDRRKQRAQIDEYYELENGHNQNISYLDRYGKLEVGLFFPESPDKIDVHLNGAICNWNREGVIEQCQKTYLFYQKAHVISPEGQGIPVDLLEPVGLHPTFSVDLRNRTSSDNCGYYLYLTTPADIFLDKFQSSPIFIAGATDLEAPEYAVKDSSWGMEALLALTPGQLNEVKLHTRYIRPQSAGGHKSVNISPVVFQACDTEYDNIHENPFYSKSSGFDALFTNNTHFSHLNSSTYAINIPAATAEAYDFIQVGTWAALFLSTLYILIKIFKK